MAGKSHFPCLHGGPWTASGTLTNQIDSGSNDYTVSRWIHYCYINNKTIKMFRIV